MFFIHDNLAFLMYAAEKEGDIPTRHGRLNQAAKCLRNSRNPHNPDRLEAILAHCNLTNVTSEELAYIRKEAGM